MCFGGSEGLHCCLLPGFVAVTVVLLFALSLQVIFGYFWVIFQGSRGLVTGRLSASAVSPALLQPLSHLRVSPSKSSSPEPGLGALTTLNCREKTNFNNF